MYYPTTPSERAACTIGYDSHPLFDDLLIAKSKSYEKHLNQQALPNSLSCVITLSYLKAREYYALCTILRRITREEHSGEGYVDFLFHPVKGGYLAIVLEFYTCARRAKCGHSAEEAIQQITPNGAQGES